MTGQIYFEDVEAGSELMPLEKVATTLMLVRWAGAIGDDNPLHYEGEFAVAQGVGRPIVHGSLKSAWLIQLMTDWTGEEGELKKLSCQYRGIDYPRQMKTMSEPHDGETWWCRGVVSKKYVKNEENLVECKIWVENGKKVKTTIGTALVSLPSRDI